MEVAANVVPSINDLLNIVEFQTFVGRDAELQLMQEQLTFDHKQWNSPHFHGISGIGKTALLMSFIKNSPETNIIYVDTDKEIQSPQQFLDNITKQLFEYSKHSNEISIDITKTYTTIDIVDCLNTIAAKNPPLLLLFDSFELWKPITKWLFESFISKLSPKVRLISAGRESLEAKWMRSNAWSLLVHNVPLKPLNKKHVNEYLKIVG